MDESIDNEFASVLVFYDVYNRSKLLSTDLAKIAKRYGSKPGQLIADLEKKYCIPIPKLSKVVNISRICQLHAVPESYRLLLPAKFHADGVDTYDPIYDIRSPLFDAEKVLISRRIISPTSSLQVYDNLSKCKPMLINFDGKVNIYDKNAANAVAPKESKGEVDLPILTRIIQDSSAKVVVTDEIGNESLQMSPFAIAHKFFIEKSRVRVIIRKRAG